MVSGPMVLRLLVEKSRLLWESGLIDGYTAMMVLNGGCCLTGKFLEVLFETAPGRRQLTLEF